MQYVTVNGCRRIPCETGDNLYKVLTSHGYVFPGNCGGHGRCERCKVYDQDTGSFVKSCQLFVDKDMSVVLTQEQKMEGITEHQALTIKNGQNESRSIEMFETSSRDISYGIAVDIGTTTIATELVNLATGDILTSASCLNSQIEVGADVVSRIQAAGTETGMLHLRALVFGDIKTCIAHMLHTVPDAKQRIIRYVLSGNATMLSIAEGYTTENLFGYPFVLKNGDAVCLRPENTTAASWTEETFAEITPEDGSEPSVLCLPNLAAFIGADVLGGACAAGLYQCDGCRMLVDLGTNGEVILCDKTKGFAASAACGSAFEGSFRKTSVYGSTLFDSIHTLRRLGRIDADGMVTGTNPERGISMGNDMTIDLDAIRAFQLGKSAIASAITILMHKMHVRASDIETVYLAGGFGFHLNVDHAVSLGLFPAEFAKKTKVLGNTSLQGAYLALMDADFIDTINGFKEKITDLSLSEESGFQDCFIRHLTLDAFYADEHTESEDD